MGFNFKKLTIIFSITGLLIICVKNFAQEARAFGAYSDLKLSATTDKVNFLPLEPINVYFTFENPTSKPIKGRMDINFSCCMTMEIRHKNKSRIITTPSLLRKGLLVKPKILEPGQSLPQQWQRLEFELNDLFPEPGEYDIRFLQSDDLGEIATTNFIKILILPPQGNDLEAYNYLLKKIDRFHESPIVENKGWFGDTQQFVLEEFLQRFGDTNYGNYAEYKLAQIYLKNKDCEKSKFLLNRLKEKKDFQDSKAVEFYLERIDKKLEKCNPNEQSNQPIRPQ